MDHIVFLDTKSKEMDKLAIGEKTMIIRGDDSRKMPYSKVKKDDILYFVYNDDEYIVKSKAVVYSVLKPIELEEDESIEFVNQNQIYLKLTPAQFKKWAGKRYLVLIEITYFEFVDEFKFDISNYNNIDDWLSVEDIKTVNIL
jgi:hypothetical protein